MSAFQCDKATYQYIADCFAHLLRKSPYVNSDYRHAFYELVPNYHELTDKQVDALAVKFANTLQIMNAQAVAGRYKEEMEVVEEIKSADYGRIIMDFNIIQFIKCLNCVMYQCAENPVDKMESYKKFSNLVNRICAKYVMGLKEYDNADWGKPDSYLVSQTLKRQI